MNGKALREAFGDEMLELGKENPDIYIVDADVGKSCKTLAFASAYPVSYTHLEEETRTAKYKGWKAAVRRILT